MRQCQPLRATFARYLWEFLPTLSTWTFRHTCHSNVYQLTGLTAIRKLIAQQGRTLDDRCECDGAERVDH